MPHSPWSSVCAGAGGGEQLRTRIAAIGDSLTSGDNMQAFNESTTKRCKMSDTNMCRGNFPFDLRELLGREGHEVRNFGVTGLSACGHLPEECLEPPLPTIPLRPDRSAHTAPSGGIAATAAREGRLPLLVNASEPALANCSAALRRPRSRLLGPALAFAPHVVLLMIGTNDAASMHWDRCGGEGFRRAMLLVLREIWRAAPPPLVLLLPPPPVLGEYRPGACVSMHALRGHSVAECTTCGKGDRSLGSKSEDGTCVSVPELTAIRHAVTGIGREVQLEAAATALDHHAPPTHAPTAPTSSSPSAEAVAGGGGGGGCAQSPLLLMHQAVPALSTLFTGPLHLNAKGSGLIACAVHERLQFQCGSNKCTDAALTPSRARREAAAGVGGGGGGDASRYNASLASARHRAYCEPLRRGVGGAAVLPHTAHSHMGHEEYGASFWDMLQGVLHSPVG